MPKNIVKPLPIGKIRSDLGLSQEEMANLMGVGRSTVARCEDGTHKIDEKKIVMAQAIAVAYNNDRADKEKIKILLSDYSVEFAYAILLIDGIITDSTFEVDPRGFLREIIKDKCKVRFKLPLIFKIFEKKEADAISEFEKITLKYPDEINTHNESGLTPLMEAASRSTFDLFKIICRRADVNVKSPISHASALHYALYPNSNKHLNNDEIGQKEAIARLLIESGADVNARDLMGQDPLTLAAGQNFSVDLIELLVNQGAIINYCCKVSPLMNAACEGNIEIAKKLIDLGAKVNLQDKNGNTALHWAVKSNQIESFKILIESGGKVDEIKNHEGETPASMANKNRKEEFNLCIENQNSNHRKLRL